MIDLYLMRHGQASFDATTDFDRALDQVGINQVEQVSQSVDIQAQTILVSPYLRAQQTLAIFNVNRNIKIEQSELITPEANINALVDALTMREETSLMIIAHNPLLSYLANVLTGLDQFSLGTASIVHLRGEIMAAGCMSLVKEFHNQ